MTCNKSKEEERQAWRGAAMVDVGADDGQFTIPLARQVIRGGGRNRQTFQRILSQGSRRALNATGRRPVHHPPRAPGVGCGVLRHIQDSLGHIMVLTFR